MRLYIETSVISFCFDTLIHNREKRSAARRLLALCRDGVHQGFISEHVIWELERSRQPYRTRDLDHVAAMGLSTLVIEYNVQDRLLGAYVRDPLLTRLPPMDLKHIATFATSDLEGLVTCNLKDIANEVILDRVRKVNHDQGIEKILRVAPPQAFIPPARE